MVCVIRCGGKACPAWVMLAPIDAHAAAAHVASDSNPLD
ncbi:protein of unknown function [Rhodovastum atsumiense]|nr:protein of unknown function [Rhodovastum atsumiense]